MIRSAHSSPYKSLFTAIMIALPVIQLGISYYVSVSFLTFVICVLFSMTSLFDKKEVTNIILIGAAAFLIKAISLTLTASNARTVFFPLREMTCFIGLVLLVTKLSKDNISTKFVKNITLWFLIFLVVLVTFQFFQIKAGFYFGIPSQYFIMNKGTLGGIQLALLHGTRLRPTAFYGEPSYTSWIVLSLLVINLSIANLTYKRAILVFTVSLAVVSVSQSIAGVLSVLAVSVFWFLFTKSKIAFDFSRIIIGSTIALLSIALILFLSKDLSTRFEAIINMTDESSLIRFQDPMLYINQIFLNSELIGISNYDEVDVDNAGLGIFIQYGLLSFIILLVIIILARQPLLILYILLSLNFNGTFFRYDKILVIGATIGLAHAFKNSTTKLTNRKAQRVRNNLSLQENTR